MARAAAGVVIGAGTLGALVFLAVAVFGDDSEERLGGLVLVFGAGLVASAGVLAWGRIGSGEEGASTERPPPSSELAAAERGETVVLRPSRKKWVLVGLGSLLFTVVLVPLAVFETNVIGIVGSVLFGLGVLVSIWQLVPGAAYLRISPEGVFVSAPLRRRLYAWNDVENFQVYEIHSGYSTQRLVGFDLRSLTPERQSFWQTINRGVSGVDVGLPDTYGVDADELAAALNHLRDRHATERGPSPSARADAELEKRAARVDTSRRPVITLLLALACVGAFVLEASRYDLAPTAAQLDALGGASSEGAWWSLLAANLLHANLVHIGLNLVAWSMIGTLLEREIGWVRMAVLSLVGGIGATGLAVVLSPDDVTVGLSGVIFAALAWGVVRDVHRTRALGAVAWSILPVSLIYTFLMPNVSIGGHLGGLAAGLVLARTLDAR